MTPDIHVWAALTWTRGSSTSSLQSCPNWPSASPGDQDSKPQPCLAQASWEALLTWAFLASLLTSTSLRPELTGCGGGCTRLAGWLLTQVPMRAMSVPADGSPGHRQQQAHDMVWPGRGAPTLRPTYTCSPDCGRSRRFHGVAASYSHAQPGRGSPALKLSVSLLRLMRKPALATASMRRDASVVFRACTLGSGTLSSLKGTSLASTLTRLTCRACCLAHNRRCSHSALVIMFARTRVDTCLSLPTLLSPCEQLSTGPRGTACAWG